MGKKSKKRDVNECSNFQRSKKDGSSDGEQENAPETDTSTVLRSKQRNPKNKKRKGDNDNLNTDSVPDEHLNKMTDESSKKRKKHGLIQETPLKVTPSCPAEASEGNSRPATQKQIKKKERNNKSDDVETKRGFEDKAPSNIENPQTITISSSKKYKKIVFDDDTPVEVTSSASKSNKKNKNFNSEEEGVKDEDIDQFCEDIPEEDNAQFDEWVKLIEAKLGSNKK